MPLYTFFCEQCKQEVDLYLSLKELKKEKTCPTCKSQLLEGPVTPSNSPSKGDSQMACDLSRRS